MPTTVISQIIGHLQKFFHLGLLRLVSLSVTKSTDSPPTLFNDFLKVFVICILNVIFKLLIPKIFLPGEQHNGVFHNLLSKDGFQVLYCCCVLLGESSQLDHKDKNLGSFFTEGITELDLLLWPRLLFTIRYLSDWWSVHNHNILAVQCPPATLASLRDWSGSKLRWEDRFPQDSVPGCTLPGSTPPHKDKADGFCAEEIEKDWWSWVGMLFIFPGYS